MVANTYNHSTESHRAIQTAIQPWIEWKHISMGRTHCRTCLKLHKCRFTKANMPMLPQHEFCHCTAVPKSTRTVQSRATAVCAYEKFAKYALDPTNPRNGGKAAMFASWGYTAADSEWMMTEYRKQAREKYIAGEYVLGVLNMHGQRISIQIVLPRKNGIGTVTYTTGWLVEQSGRIRRITPYGSK